MRSLLFTNPISPPCLAEGSSERLRPRREGCSGSQLGIGFLGTFRCPVLRGDEYLLKMELFFTEQFLVAFVVALQLASVTLISVETTRTRSLVLRMFTLTPP
jgi:hypothetical protein